MATLSAVRAPVEGESGPEALRVVCAWALPGCEPVIQRGSGAGPVSHGCCRSCAAQVRKLGALRGAIREALAMAAIPGRQALVEALWAVDAAEAGDAPVDGLAERYLLGLLWGAAMAWERSA